MNEVEKFFEGLPSQDEKMVDVFNDREQLVISEKEKEEEIPDSVKNRRHRRLESRLQAEREANIALNARLQAESEINRTSREVEIDPRLVRAFGTTDEGKEVSKIFAEMLSENTEKAREQALEEFEARQRAQSQEQQQYEDLIDSELETLEDEFNVDLTSDAPKARKMRREFLERIQKYSPKDEDGTISDYADFHATFEDYLEVQQKPDASRQKEIASRSMNRGQSGNIQQPNITPGWRGWQKDYNL